MMIRESIINFNINDIVIFHGKKGRLDKIVGNEILVYLDNRYIVVHYSRLKIINHQPSKNIYLKWSKYEIERLHSGLTPQQLCIELKRNIQNIYNKMRILNIPRKHGNNRKIKRNF